MSNQQEERASNWSCKQGLMMTVVRPLRLGSAPIQRHHRPLQHMSQSVEAPGTP